VKVELTTIDRCFADISVHHALFIKLDVEGSEYEALRGASATIRKYRPPILFEVNPSSASASGHSVRELLRLMHESGYRRVCEIDEFPERRKILEVSTERQRNLLALPD